MPKSSPRMLASRPTKLRSQRDINLWRIPLRSLSEQADAIRESATSLVALDRSDLDAAWHRARTALDTLAIDCEERTH